MAKLITNLITTYPKGFPELGMASIDPFHFTNAGISQSGDGPVSLNLTMPEGDIIGWGKMQVKEVMLVFYLQIMFVNFFYNFYFI